MADTREKSEGLIGLRTMSITCIGRGHGSSAPAVEYRNFVREGRNREVDPKVQPLREWVYGREDFLKRMLAMAAGSDIQTNRRRARNAKPLSIDQILNAIAQHYGDDAEEYCEFRSSAGGRDLAAFLIQTAPPILFDEPNREW